MADTPWHEDERFWEAFDPVIFGPELHEAAPADVEAVLSLSGALPGARVLDLCCGPGRHALELCRRGHAVTGVDRTERFLRRARESAEEEGLELELVLEDMRRFVRPDAFELVINLYTSFAYFEDDGDDLQAARNMATSLVPGGTLVLELMSKEVLARIFQERDWRPLSGGGYVLEERRLLDGWSRVASRWVLVTADGAVHEHELVLRLYSGQELRSLLLAAGFAQVELYGSLDGAPYDHQAARLVAVATR